MIALRPVAAEESRDGGAGGTSGLGLRIPADGGQPVTLTMLRLSASVLSAAIGGGLAGADWRTARRFLHAAVLPVEACVGRVADGRG